MIDKTFDLIEYLKYKGFEIKRKSDKRDILVLRNYYDSWVQENKEISVIMHYDYGCNAFMYNAGLMMEIIMRPSDQNVESFDILYKGLQPMNFDSAEILFEMILPSQKVFEKINEKMFL